MTTQNVNNWWLVHLTNTRDWTAGEVSTENLYQSYRTACVGSACGRFTFTRNLNRLLNLNNPVNTPTVTLPTLEVARNAFDNTRDWTTTPSCFQSTMTLPRTTNLNTSSVRRWWGTELANNSLPVGTINKETMYHRYSNMRTNPARRPTFWRTLHRLAPPSTRVTETAVDVTFDHDACRAAQTSLLNTLATEKSNAFAPHLTLPAEVRVTV